MKKLITIIILYFSWMNSAISFQNYSMFIEKDNNSVLFHYHYPKDVELSLTQPNLEIIDYSKFDFTKIVFSNTEDKITPLYIHPASCEVDDEYECYSNLEYKIDDLEYEYIDNKDYQIIKIKSLNTEKNKSTIGDKIEKYLVNNSSFSITVLAGGVYTSGLYSPVTNVNDLKKLFKKNPETLCRILSNKKILNIKNRELKSDLKLILEEENKFCSEENISISASSSHLMNASELPSLMCTTILKNGESGSMLAIELSDTNKYNISKISQSLIKFNWYIKEMYISASYERDTGKMRLLGFNDTEKKIISASQKLNCELENEITSRKVKKSNIDITWKVGDKFIIPECFDYVWLSGDRYETFFDEYIEKLDTHRDNPRFENFIVEIGTYLNKEVPLNHSIKTGWQGFPNGISLSRQLESCLSDEPNTYVLYIKNGFFDDGVGWNTQTDIGYEVLESYDVNLTKKFAPNINKNFDSIKKIKITEWGGGSMGHQNHTVTYGLLTIDGKKVLLPLKNHIKF